MPKLTVHQGVQNMQKDPIFVIVDKSSNYSRMLKQIGANVINLCRTGRTPASWTSKTYIMFDEQLF